MSITVSIDTNSDALLDAMEGVCFDHVGRVQTRPDVIGFVEQAQEIINNWQAKRAEDDEKRAAQRVLFEQLETATKAAVDNAPRVEAAL